MTTHLAAIAAVLSLLGLSACGGQKLAQGESDFNTGILLPQGVGDAAARPADGRLNLVPKIGPASCNEYVKDPAGAVQYVPASSDQVIRCVYELKAIIDDHYREYRITLHHFADYGNAVADITSLGLSTAATATGVSAVKTVLSAINAGVTGSKSIINEDLLYKQAIELLLTQMDADRDKQFSVILGQLNDKTSHYTIAQAKDDMLVYFGDGTWDHAIVSLQAKASANLANCQAAVDNAKTSATTGSTQSPSTATGCSASPPSVPDIGAFFVPANLTSNKGAASVGMAIGPIGDDKVTISRIPSF
jgi:hypothetical protein